MRDKGGFFLTDVRTHGWTFVIVASLLRLKKTLYVMQVALEMAWVFHVATFIHHYISQTYSTKPENKAEYKFRNQFAKKCHGKCHLSQPNTICVDKQVTEHGFNISITGNLIKIILCQLPVVVPDIKIIFCQYCWCQTDMKVIMKVLIRLPGPLKFSSQFSSYIWSHRELGSHPHWGKLP